MLKIVLDSNVIISGILNPQGNPAKILQSVFKKEVHLVISQNILDELERVFQYPKLVKLMQKKQVSSEMIRLLLSKLTNIATITKGDLNIKAVERDSDDDIIVCCAVEGQADYIVSGDDDLMVLESFQDIKIVSPSDFLRLSK